MKSISHLLSTLIHCPLCTQKHRGIYAICDRCTALLPQLGHACKHCAAPIFDETAQFCGPCAVKKPAIDKVFTLFRFEEPLRGLIHQFKYHEQLYLTAFLTHLIKCALDDDAYKTQCLIPVPMHPQRLKSRGFNQATLLTKKLARETKLPYHLMHCKKIINTAQQAQLNAQKRQVNLNKAFVLAKPLPYQHVTIIDDLITTGSTANALALTLKRAGAKRVDLWCCAKTVL